MLLTISGKGMEVSDYLRGLVEKKAKKLNRYFKEDTQVLAVLSIEKSRHIAEITVPFYGGTLLRTEESSGDMYNSIDAALKKLERKIRRHKTRLEKDLHEKAYDYTEPVFADGGEEEEIFDFESGASIVRRKTFSTKPMSAEEAAAQLELLGHSFFVFVSSETEEVNVIYKRKDRDYGLLEPEYD